MILNQLWNEYCDNYSAHTDTIMSSDDPDKDDKLDQESKRYEDKQSSILEFRSSVTHWIKEAEDTLSDEIRTTSIKSIVQNIPDSLR